MSEAESFESLRRNRKIGVYLCFETNDASIESDGEETRWRATGTETFTVRR